jgi:hypothetical protein
MACHAMLVPSEPEGHDEHTVLYMEHAAMERHGRPTHEQAGPKTVPGVT